MDIVIKQTLLVVATVAIALMSICVARADALACIQDRPWKGDESKRRPEDPLQEPLGAPTRAGEFSDAEPWNGLRGATVR